MSRSCGRWEEAATGEDAVLADVAVVSAKAAGLKVAKRGSFPHAWLLLATVNPLSKSLPNVVTQRDAAAPRATSSDGVACTAKLPFSSAIQLVERVPAYWSQ